MRGTGYAIAEIILWMLAAAVIGGLIGWILRGVRREVEVTTQWEALAKAERRQNDLLREHIEASSATIAELESGLAAPAENDIRMLTDSPARGERPVDADSATAEQGDTHIAKEIVARIAERTRGSDDIVDDDLKRIHGVGPKLEELLKSMDITSYRQVARFTADDIARIANALDAFPGRIERDDWTSSAAAEHLAKYGHTLEPDNDA